MIGGLISTFRHYMANTFLFLKLRNAYNPDLSILFLNGIAHLQHQFWTLPLSTNKKLKAGFEVSDIILGYLLKNVTSQTPILVCNGLNQTNIDDKNEIGIRQIRPETIPQILGLQCITQRI